MVHIRGHTVHYPLGAPPPRDRPRMKVMVPGVSRLSGVAAAGSETGVIAAVSRHRPSGRLRKVCSSYRIGSGVCGEQVRSGQVTGAGAGSAHQQVRSGQVTGSERGLPVNSSGQVTGTESGAGSAREH